MDDVIACLLRKQALWYQPGISHTCTRRDVSNAGKAGRMRSTQLARAIFSSAVGSRSALTAATASPRVALHRASAPVRLAPAFTSRSFAEVDEAVTNAKMLNADAEKKRPRSSSPAGTLTAQAQGQEAVKKAKINEDVPAQQSSSAKGKQVESERKEGEGKSQHHKPIKPGKITDRPLSGIFAVNKPSGRTSMSLLEDLKPLFASSSLFKDADGKDSDMAKRIPSGWRGRQARKKLAKGGGRELEGLKFPPKLGQGGTLDPLADGVLVIGVGAGTKYLNNFLAGEKEYYTVGLLGSATVSYDSQDPVMYEKPFSHVTRSKLQSTITQKFLGKVDQTPPLFSAVRIDGMRLFDYARKNKPLEKPIPPRPVEISECEVTEWFDAGEHPWSKPSKEATEEDKLIIKRVLDMVHEAEKRKQETDGVPASSEADTAAADSAPSISASQGGEEGSKEAAAAGAAPAFGLRMTVSSGTYVRCVVHDLADQVGSAAHVVRLTRLKQGPYSIPLKKGFPTEGTASEEGMGHTGEDVLPEPRSRLDQCIEWDVFVKALKEMKQEEVSQPKQEQVRPADHNDNDDDDDDAMNNATPAAAPSLPESSIKDWERILLAHITPVASS